MNKPSATAGQGDAYLGIVFEFSTCAFDFVGQLFYWRAVYSQSTCTLHQALGMAECTEDASVIGPGCLKRIYST